ncbi:polysaccharide pyruvyl transferase family protein [Thiococcus pfennigii]|uniref:polysaccharide pyruvyl transferase family protein n=1 Tax=Thiococcus pfennigii TaxID=1057 RepID=UPI0019065807|nr:polysaccharide pyruvyl transferase family protein [Thiococcus pfennigii]MBK1733234.1 hypothetical protein [Thiococcus pfennigii]
MQADRYPLVWIAHRCLTRNLGDQLLGMGLEARIKGYTPAIERVEFTGAQNLFILRILRKALKRLRFRAMSARICVLAYLPYALLKRPRLIVIGGGQLLLPNDDFMFAIETWSLVARRCGAKLAFFSVGTEERGGAFSETMQKILKSSLSSASFVRLRDGHSQKVIAGMTGTRFSLVPDTAYGLTPSCRDGAERHGVGVCPASLKSVMNYRRFQSRTEYYQAFQKHIDKHLRPGEDLLVFSTAWSDRREVEEMGRFLRECHPANPVEVVPIVDADDLLELLCRLRVVVGSRMHALILGQLAGTTVCTVARNEKLVAFEAETTKQTLESLRAKLDVEVETLLEQTGVVKNGRCNRLS